MSLLSPVTQIALIKFQKHIDLLLKVKDLDLTALNDIIPPNTQGRTHNIAQSYFQIFANPPA